jgi:hypothetical protein
MLSHFQIWLGIWTSLAVFLAVMGLCSFVGWLLLRKKT